MGTYQMQETTTNQSQASSPITEGGFDYQATNLTDDENDHGSPRMRRELNSGRINSTYIKKYRFSRYKNAISTFLPFRSVETSSSELPIDSVGCLANSSFLWVKRYLISSKTWTTYKNSLSPYIESLITNSKLRIPKTTFSDNCDVNGKRLLGLFKDEEQTRGRIKGSMLRVAWKFCSTRVLISSFIYAVSIFIGLLGPVLFLHLSLESMEQELDKKAEIYNYATANGTNFVVRIFLDHYHNSTNWNFLSAELLGIKRPNDFANNEVLDAIFIMSPNFMSNLLQPGTLEMTLNNDSSPFLRLENDVLNLQLNRVGYSFGFVLCFFAAFFLKGVTNWLNLRTATRLRSAVLSSVYRKSMESAAGYSIAAQQILTFANEESNVIFSFVENGGLIFGTAFGVFFSLIAAFVLLHVPGIWPIFGILLLFLLMIILAMFSSYHFRRGMFHSSKKLTVVEEICIYFKNIAVLGFDNIFSNRFFDSASNQYGFLRKSMILSSSAFNGGMTSAILLGGLYLNWCDVDIETNSLSVLILIIIYAYFLKYLMIEFGQSVQSIAHGKAALGKVMNSYALTKPKPSKSRPPEPLLCSCRDAAFQWPKTATSSPSITSFQLTIEEFFVPKHQIVGITGRSGSGKTSLLYSLLGHTQLIRGVVRQKDRMAFFPKEPVLIAGSLKDNILMGAEFNPQRYYTAINAVKLTEDVIVKTDSDEISIGALELDREQVERVVLARAVYSDRLVFLFDEPLASIKDVQKSSFYMQNVLELLLQTKKTVVLATQNNQFLAICQKIYYLEDGKIYKDGNYFEFLNVAVFTNMIKEYEILRSSAGFDENINGCNSNAVSVVKDKPRLGRRSVGISMADSTVNSEEMLLEQKNKNTNSLGHLSAFSYIFLFIVYLVSSVMYFTLPLGFIIVVKRKYIEPWLSYISIGIIIASFIIDMLSKFRLAFASENLSMQYNKKLFKNLQATTINYLKTTIISDIIHWFDVDVFTVFQPYAIIIQCTVAIFFSLALLVFANCWTLLLVPLLLTGFILIFLKVRYTISHFCQKECESRNKLFMLVTNHLKGRVVVQSFDKLVEFSRCAHEVIEENTTAIFLRKSIKYYAQFLLNCMLGLGLSLICLILLLTPFSKLSVHRYVLAIFAYYSFAYYLNRLLFDGLLEMLVSNNKMENMESNLKKIEIIKSPATRDTVDVNTGIMSLSFNEVICKISTKKLLELRKVHCKDAETLGVVAKGANCIIPLLYRILNPCSGAIFISAHDLQQFTGTQLKSLLGVIFFDPLVPSISVKTFLDPHSTLPRVDLTNALRAANLFERLQKSMDDPVGSLTLCERQLLGLAKCLIAQPKIIIFENIHPEVQFIMDMCIKKHFSTSTILVVGRLESLGACDRKIEL